MATMECLAPISCPVEGVVVAVVKCLSVGIEKNSVSPGGSNAESRQKRTAGQKAVTGGHCSE